jgi:3-hydroxyisobutyrate dehydrogenase
MLKPWRVPNLCCRQSAASRIMPAPGGAGAALKLVVNALLGIQVAALGELLGVAERLGLDRRRAGEVLVEMPSCSPTAKAVNQAMLARNFGPAFPVELVEKDLGYLADEKPPDGAPMSTAARAVFARAMVAGLAPDNMTAVVKLYDKPRPTQRARPECR